MHKTDCEINNWVASWMVGEYDWVSNATADCEENFGVDDVVFSATTKSGDIVVRCAEVKSIKGGFNFKYDGQWNNWFSTMNPDGIMKKLKFGNTPPPSMDIMDVPLFWEPEVFSPTDEPMPEEWENKHIYMLNATDIYHRVENGKTYKVYNNNASLIYVASDGLITYNPHRLRKSFLGYAWYLNKSHTEEHNKKYEPVWELKAIFNLEEGSYHQANVPKELLIKNKKYN